VPSAIPAPPARRGRTGIVILSILTAVLLLGAGVMTTLFLAQKSEVDKANTQINTLNSTVSTQNDKLSTLQKNLDTTQRDLTDAKADADEMANQKKVIADCVNAIYAFWREIDKSGANSSATEKKGKALDTACHAADKYL
jgi:outer membrane murein-binding lipoprotein Lpp